jgi:hypothetical protein
MATTTATSNSMGTKQIISFLLALSVAGAVAAPADRLAPRIFLSQQGSIDDFMLECRGPLLGAAKGDPDASAEDLIIGLSCISYLRGAVDHARTRGDFCVGGKSILDVGVELVRLYDMTEPNGRPRLKYDSGDAHSRIGGLGIFVSVYLLMTHPCPSSGSKKTPTPANARHPH